ncbi:MAG: DNA-binding response regulator [Omnitrophica WOR_2 bacterium RIFCSPHIGHO2_02_FULL_52_10]|nr:MAG: DNA-binding response regulator [Omnitrophica WOR_2 bacterium RIFCSPHIGHO2_02_FULL_52_10]
MSKILIAEDDKNILAGLVDILKLEGHTTVIARDGETAVKQVQERKPDLLILDVMLPKLNGFEVCKRLKKEGSAVPIIILSAQGEEADKVLGLELGADDYVTKPFSPRELTVRIKAVLRRSRPEAKVEDSYEFDNIKVDFKRFQAFRAGQEVKMTSAEFKILKLLLANKGEPVSRHTILGDIWSSEVTTRTVDTHIWNLREKLESDPGNPKHIITVHRIGYKFVE